MYKWHFSSVNMALLTVKQVVLLLEKSHLVAISGTFCAPSHHCANVYNSVGSSVG